jgi:predicted metal-dependent TIM-barrel fold hydrolase
MDAPLLFDAHVHAHGLSTQDLESMRFFGVQRALLFPEGREGGTVKETLKALDALVEDEPERFVRAGIQPFLAVGVHPRRVPRRGLIELLERLPHYFSANRRVVALGETGLSEGGEAEEEAFLAQVDLAKRLKLPLVVHTPWINKGPMTRRTLTLLREVKVTASRVLVAHANVSTVKLILACGHHAGLTLHPEMLKAERAVALVGRLGPGRLVLGSGGGSRPGDVLSVARALSLLARAGLSRTVQTRLAHENLERFLGIGAGA